MTWIVFQIIPIILFPPYHYTKIQFDTKNFFPFHLFVMTKNFRFKQTITFVFAFSITFLHVALSIGFITERKKKKTLIWNLETCKNFANNDVTKFFINMILIRSSFIDLTHVQLSKIDSFFFLANYYIWNYLFGFIRNRLLSFCFVFFQNFDLNSFSDNSYCSFSSVL